MNLSKDQILAEIKRRVKAVDPDAEIWLFGSRARGDNRPDSDLDIIILVDYPVNIEIERKFTYPIFDYGIETGQVFMPLIYSRQQWQNMKYHLFHKEVERDKIII